MEQQTYMRAPSGVNQAIVDGYHYKIATKGKDAGVIKVAQDSHIPTLRRHGFIDHHKEIDPAELAAEIEAMDEKSKLVEFIEERGGEADDSMSFKKLRRKAREAAGIAED